MHFNAPNHPIHLIRTDVKADRKEKEVQGRSKMRFPAMLKQEEQRMFKLMSKKPTHVELKQEFKKLEDDKNALTVVVVDQKKEIAELKRKRSGASAAIEKKDTSTKRLRKKKKSLQSTMKIYFHPYETMKFIHEVLTENSGVSRRNLSSELWHRDHGLAAT